MNEPLPSWAKDVARDWQEVRRIEALCRGGFSEVKSESAAY
jgi:hypothetical protein